MSSAPVSLGQLNTSSVEEFVAVLGPVFEHSPWVAERAAQERPYPTVAALHDAMMSAVLGAAPETQLAFLRGHPELAGAAARRRELAEFSAEEQSGLDFGQLEAEQAQRFDRMNADYGHRFGFPFIICVRRHTRASIVAEFERRLRQEPEAERRTALDEIARITRLRLVALVDGPGQPPTTGRLTTHVLDTALGRPAAGVAVRLFEIEGERLHPLTEALTNEDGRVDRPLLGGGPLRIGRYELRFDLVRYFAGAGQSSEFLDIVPIRFAIGEAESHYHVPLLIAPGGYTTYRGS